MERINVATWNKQQTEVMAGFSKKFGERNAKQRAEKIERRKKVEQLIEEGITNIHLLAYHTGLTASTMRCYCRELGFRVSNSVVSQRQ